MSGKLYASMAFLIIGIVLLLNCFNDPTSPEETGAASLNFNFSWDGDSTASDAVEELHMSITSNEIADTIRGRFNYAEATGSFDKEIPAGIPVTITVTAVSADGELLYSGKTSVSQTVSQTAVGLELKKSTPRGPENIQIPTRASDAITFQWQDRSSHEDGYIIYRSVDAKNYVAIDTLGTNLSSYTDSLSLQNAHIYHYRVYAFNKVGLSEIFCTGKVRYGNWSPVFSPAAPLSNYQLRGNGDTLTVEVMVTDEDSDQVEISYSVDTTVFPRPETISFENNVFTWGSEPGDAGQFTIAFIASDGNEQVRKEVTLSVTGVNLPPVLSVDGLEKGAHVKLNEGKKLAFTILADDPNEGQSVDFLEIEHAPWDDTLSGTGSFDRETGAFLFSPAFSAVDGQTSRILDTIVITAQDDHQSPAVGTFRFTIEILDSNSAPVWLKNELDVAATENEKVTVNFSELFDTDHEGDVVTFTADIGVIDAQSGNWYYTPTFDDAGDMTVTITAHDNHTPPASSDLTLNLSIADKNRAPEFVTDKPQGTYVLVGDGDALDIATAATDSDGDSVTIWYELVDTASLPRADDISFIDNTLHWASATGDKGRFILHFFATDQIDTVEKVVEVSIDGANVAPEISIEGHEERVFAISEGKTLELTFVGFDRNEGQHVAFTGIQNAPWEEPLNGSGSFDTTTKMFTYTPAFTVTNGGETAEFDSIIVTAVDDYEEPLTARFVFTVQVIDSNSAPQWSEDTVNVYGTEGELVTFDFSDVLVGDAEGDGIDFTASKGTINNTTLQWSWQTGFNNDGLNYITISATDDHLPPAESRLCLAVSIGNTNRSPVANDASLSMDEDGVLDIVLDAEDADGDALEYTIESDVRNGTLTAGATPGAYIYEPNPDFWGSDSFSFSVSDDSASSAIATVIIGVEEINDKPNAANDSYTIPEDSVYICTVLDNDSDVDGDDLSIIAASGATHGLLSITDDELSIRYAPEDNYFGPDTFTYVITDGRGESATATVYIIVAEANDPPHFTRNSNLVEITEGESILDSVLAEDVDGTIPTVEVVDITPAAGWLSVESIEGGRKFLGTPGNDVSSGEPVVFTVILSATDGSATVFDTLKVRVVNTNLLPEIRFSGINDGNVYAVGSDVTVNAEAADSDGDVVCIKIYQNGTLLALDSSSTASATITTIEHRAHALRAVAYDGLGDSASKEIRITTGRWLQYDYNMALNNVCDYAVNQSGIHFLLTNHEQCCVPGGLKLQFLNSGMWIPYPQNTDGLLAERSANYRISSQSSLAINPITGEKYVAMAKTYDTTINVNDANWDVTRGKLEIMKIDSVAWSLVDSAFETELEVGNYWFENVQISFTPTGTPVVNFYQTNGNGLRKHSTKILEAQSWVDLNIANDEKILSIENHKGRLVGASSVSGIMYMKEYVAGSWNTIGAFSNTWVDKTVNNLMIDHKNNLWVTYYRWGYGRSLSYHGSVAKYYNGNNWNTAFVDTVGYTNANIKTTSMMFDTLPLISEVSQDFSSQSGIFIKKYHSGVLEPFPINADTLTFGYGSLNVIPGRVYNVNPSFVAFPADTSRMNAHLFVFDKAE